MHSFIKTTDVDQIGSAKNTIFKSRVHFEMKELWQNKRIAKNIQYQR